MKEILVNLYYNRLLVDKKDTKIYRNKGLRHTYIKTIMGNVKFSRLMCKFRTEDGKSL